MIHREEQDLESIISYNNVIFKQQLRCCIIEYNTCWGFDFYEDLTLLMYWDMMSSCVIMCHKKCHIVTQHVEVDRLPRLKSSPSAGMAEVTGSDRRFICHHLWAYSSPTARSWMIVHSICTYYQMAFSTKKSLRLAMTWLPLGNKMVTTTWRPPGNHLPTT